MNPKFPPDDEFQQQLREGIEDALNGNVISERESLAHFGIEPDDEGDDYDPDWTPDKEIQA